MIFLSLAPKKEVSGIKRFQGGVCVSCVRLRFVFTKLIVPTLLRLLRCFAENKVMPSEKVSDGICVSCVRLRFVFTKLIVPTLLRLLRCFAENKAMPSEGFQTAFVCHAYDYALFHKANRSYASDGLSHSKPIGLRTAQIILQRFGQAIIGPFRFSQP